MVSQVSVPLPPKEMVAFGFNRKTIVRWTSAEAADGNTSHNIYWSTLPGVKRVNGTKIADVASPYTHEDLNNGMTYYYVATSVNQYGESIESEEVSVTPAQGDTPSAPTGVKAVAGDRQAVISWDAFGGVAAAITPITYNIYWSLSANVSSASGTKIKGVTSPYTHSGLVQGNTYYYVVTAENAFGESDDSAKVSATIPDVRRDVCVSLGDSITVGNGASSYASSYVPLLSARWGKTIFNESVGGAYSSYGAAIIDDVLNEYNPRYITIYYGTNDAGLMYPDATIANLQHIIARAKAYGTTPVIATLGPSIYEWSWRRPYMLDLSQRIRQLAASQGIACADIDTALGWNNSYMADGLHPNDTGHRIIADTFYQALTQ